MKRPDLTPCLICEKAVVYLWGPETTFEATNLNSACDIEIYGAYGSNYDTMTYKAIICDECMDEAIQKRRVTFVKNAN